MNDKTDSLIISIMNDFRDVTGYQYYQLKMYKSFAENYRIEAKSVNTSI